METLQLDKSNYRLRYIKQFVSAANVTWEKYTSYDWPRIKNGWKTENVISRKTSLKLVICENEPSESKAFEVFLEESKKLKEGIKGNSLYEWVKPRFHILKSNAQKAMRLNRLDTCLKSTLLVLLTNHHDMMQDIIKRWYIIAAEDGTFSPFLSYFLFFFLAMQQGYKLTEFDKFIVMQCVAIVSRRDVTADWRCDFVIPNETRVVHCKRDPYDVYIGRPTEWGNPFKITNTTDRVSVIDQFRSTVDNNESLKTKVRQELAGGKRLGCYCYPLLCHGDLYCEIANENLPKINISEEEQRLMLLGLQIKACNGGLNGDMQLLYDIRNVLIKRFKTRIHPLSFIRDQELMLSTDWYEIDQMHGVDWTWNESTDQILSAVDMHCTAVAEYFIKECGISHELEQKIGNLIWDERSSLRIRRCTCGQHPDNEVTSGKGNIRETDPSWWKEKIVPRIDEVCVKEWKNLFLQNWQRRQPVEPKPKRAKSAIDEAATETNSLMSYFTMPDSTSQSK